MWASSHTTRSPAVGRPELLLHVLVAREFVEPGDGEIGFDEPVAGARGFQLVVGQNLEGKVKAPVEFVLPLLGEAAGADNQAALEIAARDQFPDEQPGHDGLAGARVVGEQEAQRLARQHGFIDRGDLVRQRIDHRGVHREHGVEQMREADALRFGDQAEERAVAVEAPGPPLLHNFDASFVVTVEQLVGHRARGGFVGEFQRSLAEPLHGHDGHERIRQDAADHRVRPQIFQG